MGDDDASGDFKDQIYNAITKVYGSRNPQQLFCLCWPGTVLDYDFLKWDKAQEVAGTMPEHALLRSSLILDQYVPPAPITQPDGTRVSDRYRQALMALGPMPNADLIALQKQVRNRLQVTVTETVDGQKQEFTLVGWFNYLYTQWAQAKAAWGQLQAQQRAQFLANDPKDPDAAYDAYLQWYEANADGNIQLINGKWERLLAEFPLNEWEDAIAILDTRDNSGLEEARLLMQNEALPIPYQEGVDYVPTQGVPYDWPLELQPVTKYIDLLADPAAQKMAVDTALAELQQEYEAWMAILPQVSDAEVQKAATAFGTALNGFSGAQSALLGQYTDNAVTAVKIYAQIQQNRTPGGLSGTPTGDDQTEQAGQIDHLRQNLDKQNPAGNDTSKQQKNDMSSWGDVSAIADQIGNGQKGLIASQQALVDAGTNLAQAANTLLADQAKQTQFPWLTGYVTQLQSKIEAVQTAEANMASAANTYHKYLQPALADPNAKDPNASPDFGANAFPTTLDTPAGDRWASITADISVKSLSAKSSLSTYFSKSQWSVDLFFGSAGGSSEQQGSSFASQYMSNDASIQIGFLATKVLIERPWMKPELFNGSGNFFRTMKGNVARTSPTTGDQIKSDPNVMNDVVSNYVLPAYPVALLIAKDVTVKVQLDASKTEDVRNQASSNKSEGGGLLCFSVSKTESTSSQSESMSSYAMAGQLVARAPSPQILGYWIQMMPPDRSQLLTTDQAGQIVQALGFVTKLQSAHGAHPAVKSTPAPFTSVSDTG